MRAASCGLLLITACSVAGSTPDRLELTFERTVGNIEQSTERLLPHPATGGDTWQGRIPRRLEQDIASLGTDHFVPFRVDYENGVAARAWCDTDLDGDLSDEPPRPLAGHPSGPDVRSFLVELAWTARHQGKDIPVNSTVRVVLEPMPEIGGPPSTGPLYRLQTVFAMMGTAVLEGAPHRAFLLDGDGDGLITSSLSDGLFVDLDDDGRVVVDQMSEEFGSLRVPFVMGRRTYQAGTVDPDGRRLVLHLGAPAEPLPPAPRVDGPAPDFSLLDLEGRVRRLRDRRGHWVFLYFWASWCPACEDQAEELARLRRDYGPRGFEILGVSYDTQHQAMRSFRERHAHDWPTSFSGRMLWEDPVGRLYRQHGSGVGYLVRPDGIIDGIFSSAPDLRSRLEAVLVRS
ncbi:MAG: peroxiredoxin family protein [Candidatus Polarisedimenticolia bacterium]